MQKPSQTEIDDEDGGAMLLCSFVERVLIVVLVDDTFVRCTKKSKSERVCKGGGGGDTGAWPRG